MAISKSIGATHTTIEPCDERSSFRIVACSKKPEPFDGMFIKIEKGSSKRDKPDALVRSDVAISRRLIDMWCGFCQNCEHDSGP